MTLEEIFFQGIKAIKGEKHRDYDRVTKLAEDYYTYITGEGIPERIERFSLRETEEGIEQRKRIAKSIVPAALNRPIQSFNRVPRSSAVTKSIIVESESDKSKVDKSINNFWGKESIDKYIESVFVSRLSHCDPNAFVVVEYEINEGDINFYPYEVSSKDAVHYFYDNNELNYLVDLKVVNRGLKEFNRFTLYSSDFNYVFDQLAPEESDSGVDVEKLSFDQVQDQMIISVESNRYKISVIQNETGRIQAFRVGYSPDVVTQGRTVVSTIHSAIPRAEKLIQADSEFDLTRVLHVFPQKSQVFHACTGTVREPCDNGKTLIGETCKVCSGSGRRVVSSAQDIIEVEMPSAEEMERGISIPDLSKLVHYHTPDINLIKFQDEYIDKLALACNYDIFTQNHLESSSTKTATEMDYNNEDKYDTLYMLGESISSFYRHAASFIVEKLSVKDPKITHYYWKDLKLKTVQELLSDLEKANTSNAPEFVKEQIVLDIANKKFVDDPKAMNKFKIKNGYLPFKNKSKEETSNIILSGLSTDYNITLYIEFSNIFSKLERESMRSGKDFYDIPETDRERMIDEEVNRIIDDKKSKSIDELNLSNLDGETE